MIQKALNENGYKTDEALSLTDTEYYTDIRKYDLILIDTDFGKDEVLNLEKLSWILWVSSGLSLKNSGCVSK